MNLFQFRDPLYLWLLLSILLLISIYIISQFFKKKAINRFSDQKLFLRLIPDYSKYRIIFKFSLTALALFFMIIALARPQSGSKVKTETNKNREIIIALDVSNSMLAEDVLPNRLKRAKQVIIDLFENNPSDRFGLIVFAGDAFVQMPVTTSISAIEVFLESVNTETVPIQGTNISKAIEMGTAMFDKTSNSEKMILILTDGENHEQKAIENAKQALDKGIIVSTAGIGKKAATPIPDPKTGEYKKNNNKIVLTKLNDILLTQIANAGGGMYFETGNFSSDIRKIQTQIDNLGSIDGETEIEEYADLFQYFIAAALFFLIFEFFLLEKRNHKLTNLSIFK